MTWSGNSVYVSGNARSPERSTVGNLYEVFAVELVVDINKDIIEDASCTLITDLGRNFVRDILVQRNIIKDFGKIISDINTYYQAVPQKALITALKDAYNKYCSYKKNKATDKSFQIKNSDK